MGFLSGAAGRYVGKTISSSRTETVEGGSVFAIREVLTGQIFVLSEINVNTARDVVISAA
jgi:hypothetical protein